MTSGCVWLTLACLRKSTAAIIIGRKWRSVCRSSGSPWRVCLSLCTPPKVTWWVQAPGFMWWTTTTLVPIFSKLMLLCPLSGRSVWPCGRLCPEGGLLTPEYTTTSFWTSCSLDFETNRLRTVTRNCESCTFLNQNRSGNLMGTRRLWRFDTKSISKVSERP